MRTLSFINPAQDPVDDPLRREMMRYYDERAEEYDEVYSGRGPAFSDPQYYRDDVREITRLVSAFGEGSLIDIGSGTGFWLPHYARNCTEITLVDQSDRMLNECRRRIATLRLEEICHLIKGDFFTHDLPAPFNSALAGFFVSHLPPLLETHFFERLVRLVEPDGHFMIIDSVWSELRSGTTKKEGKVTRRLNDGRRFDIYKKYFELSEVEEMYRQSAIELEALYFGKVFFAAAGRRRES